MYSSDKIMVYYAYCLGKDQDEEDQFKKEVSVSKSGRPVEEGCMYVAQSNKPTSECAGAT